MERDLRVISNVDFILFVYVCVIKLTTEYATELFNAETQRRRVRRDF